MCPAYLTTPLFTLIQYAAAQSYRCNEIFIYIFIFELLSHLVMDSVNPNFSNIEGHTETTLLERERREEVTYWDGRQDN